MIARGSPLLKVCFVKVSGLESEGDTWVTYSCTESWLQDVVVRASCSSFMGSPSSPLNYALRFPLRFRVNSPYSQPFAQFSGNPKGLCGGG